MQERQRRRQFGRLQVVGLEMQERRVGERSRNSESVYTRTKVLYSIEARSRRRGRVVGRRLADATTMSKRAENWYVRVDN